MNLCAWFCSLVEIPVLVLIVLVALPFIILGILGGKDDTPTE